jgi:enoyl-CoA hydratase/carnithine racemase
MMGDEIISVIRSGGHAVDGTIDKLIGHADGAIGWLIFNNPERRNAVSLDMWAAVPPIIAAFHADPSIKAIVLTGSGGKAFVSGADISEFEKTRSSHEANDEYRRISGLAGAAIARSAKPTIAMIRGVCIGGGLATALNCDLRIASEGSRFGIPAARLGIGYPFAGIQRLVALVGPAQAKAIMFTARHYPAIEAQAIGLINETVADGALEERTLELAGMIAANAPLSIAASKLAIDEAVKDPGDRDIAAITEAVSRAMGSDDFKEGRRAFMEKRSPVFTGT